jgi:hypothetical protein
MKTYKDINKKLLEERYEELGDIYAEIFKDKIQQIVIDICDDDRLLAMEWCGYIQEGYTFRVARLAIEKALELAMNDEATFAETMVNPWGE